MRQSFDYKCQDRVAESVSDRGDHILVKSTQVRNRTTAKLFLILFLKLHLRLTLILITYLEFNRYSQQYLRASVERQLLNQLEIDLQATNSANSTKVECADRSIFINSCGRGTVI